MPRPTPRPAPEPPQHPHPAAPGRRLRLRRRFGVRQVDGTQASASAAGSGSATGSPSASQVACKPVGTPSADASKVEVEVTEWAVRPATSTINAGQVTFQARNTGADPHELVIVRGDNPTSLPLAADQTVDEAKLPTGAFIGEIEAFPAKQTCTGAFTLSPGRYVLFCNLLEQEAGVEETTSEGHAHHRDGRIGR